MMKCEREAAFYKQLEFETDRMRGKLVAGPNRMNICTVQKVMIWVVKYYVEESGKKANALTLVL